MDPKDVIKAERSEPNPKRVEAIVMRARREVAARDLLEFGGAKIWVTLLGMLGRLMSVLAPSPTTDTAGAPPDSTRRTRENSQ